MSTDASAIPASPAPEPSLPTDLAACHALILQLLDDQKQKSHAIERLEYKVQDLLRRLYGRSSEKIDPKQLVLFAEMLGQLKEQAPAEPEPPATPPVKTAPAKGHGRRRLPLVEMPHPVAVSRFTAWLNDRGECAGTAARIFF